jgi:hypothetical protein
MFEKIVPVPSEAMNKTPPAKPVKYILLAGLCRSTASTEEALRRSANLSSLLS